MNFEKFISQGLIQSTTTTKELNERKGERSGIGFVCRNDEGIKKKSLMYYSTCKQGISETGGWLKEEIE